MLFVNKSFFLSLYSSAYEQVGRQFQIESRIISSSIEPPPGALVKPVIIVFSGVKVIVPTGLNWGREIYH